MTEPKEPTSAMRKLREAMRPIIEKAKAAEQSKQTEDRTKRD